MFSDNECDKDLKLDCISSAVFSLPNLATVGMSEEKAIELYGVDNIKALTTRFKSMKYSMRNSQQKDFIKVIYNKSSKKILGCHMISDCSAEVIQPLSVLIAKEATLKDFDIIPLHPSVSEEILLMLGREV